jgi:hypothetical protein
MGVPVYALHVALVAHQHLLRLVTAPCPDMYCAVVSVANIDVDINNSVVRFIGTGRTKLDKSN